MEIKYTAPWYVVVFQDIVGPYSNIVYGKLGKVSEI